MTARAMQIAKSQAAVCETIAKDVWQAVSDNQPADKSLNRIFHKNRQLGSRDRRLIRNTVFGMFRWWGWVAQWESSSWPKLLLAAYLLEGHPWHNVCSVWAQQSQLSEDPWALTVPSSLSEKSRWLAQNFHENIEAFPMEGLVPKWFFPQIEGASEELAPDFKMTLLASLQRRPPLWIRNQSHSHTELKQQLDSTKIKVQVSEQLSNALTLEGAINVHEIPAFKQGQFEVQDLASQCVGHVCNPQPGERWWDVCAGSGGKTLHLAALMAGKGQIVATDLRETMLQELRKRAKRGHWHNIQVSIPPSSATLLQSSVVPMPQSASIELFDGILVDAPCSNLGTWARNPDARWRVDPNTFSDLATQQLAILCHIQDFVKPGGKLVYATCSFSTLENQSVIQQFLEKHPHYHLASFPHPLTQEIINGMLNIWPQQFQSDGMFIALLQNTPQSI